LCFCHECICCNEKSMNAENKQTWVCMFVFF
jgi:hypothetical protein